MPKTNTSFDLISNDDLRDQAVRFMKLHEKIMDGLPITPEELKALTDPKWKQFIIEMICMRQVK